jgi:hypothetical protein
MNALNGALRRVLRGRAASRLLAGLGIDPKRYWLLMDLFGAMADHGETMDQLGWSGSALKTLSLIYFLMTGVMTLMMAIARPAPMLYSATFLGLTAFLMLVTLVSEAGNSLVNPAEGMVLAHQPINGATYTGAKLSHLFRIVLYLVPAMNAAPALAGLRLKGADWRFPVLMMGEALGVGLLAALLTCSTYGWLLRFVPAKRLKAAAQIAGGVPFLLFMFTSSLKKAARVAASFIPRDTAVRLGIEIALGAAAIAIVVFGIRSLSADYLVRVSSITRGGRGKFRRAGRPRIADIVARFRGGPGARAGFAYVSRMITRDYQIRRQIVGFLPMLIILAGGAIKSISTDPFLRKFTPLHLAPHVIGLYLFIVCSILAYGSDFKGAWVFQLAPAGVLGRFACGVHAFLWVAAVLGPHVLLFPLLAWFWGPWHSALFVLFSAGVVSLYLGFALRLIESIPFSRQPEVKRGAMTLPLMVLVLLVAGIASGLQHFLLFRSETAVLASAAVLGLASWAVTGRSLSAFEFKMRFTLGLISGESKLIYTEIG